MLIGQQGTTTIEVPSARLKELMDREVMLFDIHHVLDLKYGDDVFTRLSELLVKEKGLEPPKLFLG